MKKKVSIKIMGDGADEDLEQEYMKKAEKIILWLIITIKIYYRNQLQICSSAVHE